MIKAVIFDCDGTLLNSERIYMSTWNMVANPMGYVVPEDLLLATRGKSGTVGRKMFIETMGDEFPIDEISAKRRVMNEDVFYATSPEEIVKPGVWELIHWLKKHNFKIAVASAKSIQMTSDHLRYAGLYDCADVILGRDHVVHNKPAPDLFLKAMELLGVTKEECFVCGDTPSDVEAAHAAGIRMVFIPDLVPASADIRKKAYQILAQINELIPIIENVNKCNI